MEQFLKAIGMRNLENWAAAPKQAILTIQERSKTTYKSRFAHGLPTQWLDSIIYVAHLNI